GTGVPWRGGLLRHRCLPAPPDWGTRTQSFRRRWAVLQLPERTATLPGRPTAVWREPCAPEAARRLRDRPAPAVTATVSLRPAGCLKRRRTTLAAPGCVAAV